MIKLILTSDWHLGNVFHECDRYEEHKAYLDWLLKEIEDRQPDTLLVCGDIFDNANPSAASQELYYAFLDRVYQQSPHTKVIVIAGNHDSANRIEAPRPLLARHHVEVRGRLHIEDGQPDFANLIIPVENRQGERALILALPYLRESEYLRGEPYSDQINGAIRSLIATAQDMRQANEPLILMAHLYASGASIATENPSERIVIGSSEMVSMGCASELLSLTVLGHLHRRQCVGGNRAIRYAGSALPMSFTEIDYEHGAEYIEINADGTFGEPAFLSFPLPHPLMLMPEKPANEQEVLRLIGELPEKDTADIIPFVKVQVAMETPDPGLNKRITDALQGKAAICCAVVPSYPAHHGENELTRSFASIEDIWNQDPINMIRISYQNKYGGDLPDELARLARQAIAAAKDIQNEA